LRFGPRTAWRRRPRRQDADDAHVRRASARTARCRQPPRAWNLMHDHSTPISIG
jgi:hypothetical protein